MRDFVAFVTAHGVLRFGEFTLKSGRHSRYFFDIGAANTGAALAELGRYYASTIIGAGLEFDMLFGPAYKGIPLVATVAIALAEHHGRDVPWCFNRKEAKDHGEGGTTVGAPLRGRVLIVDDVITTGATLHESLWVFPSRGATLAGVVVALDRRPPDHARNWKVTSIITELDLSVHRPFTA